MQDVVGEGGCWRLLAAQNKGPESKAGQSRMWLKASVFIRGVYLLKQPIFEGAGLKWDYRVQGRGSRRATLLAYFRAARALKVIQSSYPERGSEVAGGV
jgi:hypothetical protein